MRIIMSLLTPTPFWRRRFLHRYYNEPGEGHEEDIHIYPSKLAIIDTFIGGYQCYGTADRHEQKSGEH